MAAVVVALVVLSVVCYIGQGFLIGKSALLLNEILDDMMRR